MKKQCRKQNDDKEQKESVKNKKSKNSSYNNENSNTNNNTNSSTNSDANSTANISDEERAALLKSLSVLDLSLVGIALILYGLFLSINYIFWERGKVVDILNNTNYSAGSADLSDNPRKTNLLYLLGIILFIVIIWDNYVTAASQTGEARNERTIQDRYKNFIAILLILLATTINYDVLNTPNAPSNTTPL